MRRIYDAGGTPATVTVDAFLRDWLRAHGPNISAATRVSYSGHIEKHISPLLGGILIGKLQPSDVRRLIADRLAAGLSPATVGRIVTTLRIALGQAHRERSLPDNPAAGVRLPRVEHEPIRALTVEQVVRIREAIRGDQFEALYVLLMGSGLRVGEACALDWRDVDLDAGTVFIRRGKTARSVRTVPVGASVIAALRQHRAHAKRVGPGEPVFLGPRAGERLRTWTISHAFPRLLERHGLPPMRVHDLRHGYATRAVARGVHMRVIADNLGHSNPAITARVYAHVVPEDQRAAADIVGSELG